MIKKDAPSIDVVLELVSEYLRILPEQDESLSHLGKYAVLEYTKSFADIPSNNWVARTLEVLAAKHIINGTSDTHFTPNGQTTCAEFTSLLAVEEVNKAIAAGLLQGKGNGIFDAASEANRAETAQPILNLFNQL